MGPDATMALAVATVACAANRRERRTVALASILARQQIRAAVLLGVAPLPMHAARVGTLGTDGVAIFYSEDYLLGAMGRLCDTPGCAVSAILGMLAHELAHAYMHRGALVHSYILELDADWIAGWVLGLAGVCPRDFLRALAELGESATHPSPRYRAEVVTHGYARGSATRAVR